jgi:hypothetical protein
VPRGRTVGQLAGGKPIASLLSYLHPPVWCSMFRLNSGVTECDSLFFSHSHYVVCMHSDWRYALLRVRMWDTFCVLTTTHVMLTTLCVYGILCYCSEGVLVFVLHVRSFLTNISRTFVVVFVKP